VAACALVLLDRGVIGLDDPITAHLTAAGSAWDDVTVRHLLTHTSGMTHWGDQPGFNAAAAIPADERLRLFLAAPRPEPAGERFHYSSPGYIVLGAVLAAASGRSYPDLAHELVIDPLGLAETHLGSPGPGPVARGYRDGQPVPSWDLGSMPGTGDVWSTTGDLARFVSALHTGGLLPPSVQPLLYGVRVPAADETPARVRAEGYQGGHFVGTIDGQSAYLHPGDNPGYRSLALWLPYSSTAVVVLSNEESADLTAVAADLVATLS
jgi:CubicO group peptidase (beta-lactamase class C family)